MFKVNNKDTNKYAIRIVLVSSSVSIVNFEQVNAGGVWT